MLAARYRIKAVDPALLSPGRAIPTIAQGDTLVVLHKSGRKRSGECINHRNRLALRAEGPC